MTEQQYINYGNTANDGTGDSLREAFIKVDDNFTAIWAAGPVGSNVAITNNTIGVLNTNGNLVLAPNGVGVVQINNSLVPRSNNVYSLGTPQSYFRSAWIGAGGLTVVGNIDLTGTLLGNISLGNLTGNLETSGFFIGNGFIGNTVIASRVRSDDSSLVTVEDGLAVENTLIVTGDASVDGNVNTAGFFIGDGGLLSNLAISAGSRLDSGNSNVAVSENSVITMGVSGVPAVFDLSSNNLTLRANVLPSANAVYDLGSATQVFRDIYLSNGSIRLGNATISANATAVVLTNESGQAAVVQGSGDISPYSDANVASLLAAFGSNAISTTGNITAGYFIGDGSQLTGVAGDYGNANVAAYLPTNTANVGAGNVVATGVVTAASFNGNGSALTSTLTDRGGDSNNWNTLTQMGVYRVNRSSWAGTTGTPLDSLIFVGVLQVLTSGDASTQIFLPGQVEAGDEKIQWNRSYWDGSWTAWTKIVNNGQIIDAGAF